MQNNEFRDSIIKYLDSKELLLICLVVKWALDGNTPTANKNLKWTVNTLSDARKNEWNNVNSGVTRVSWLTHGWHVSRTTQVVCDTCQPCVACNCLWKAFDKKSWTFSSCGVFVRLLVLKSRAERRHPVWFKQMEAGWNRVKMLACYGSHSHHAADITHWDNVRGRGDQRERERQRDRESREGRERRRDRKGKGDGERWGTEREK